MIHHSLFVQAKEIKRGPNLISDLKVSHPSSTSALSTDRVLDGLGKD